MERSLATLRILAFSAVYLFSDVALVTAATNVGGTIRDALGNPLPHAHVTVIPQGKETRGGVVADLHNRWTAANDKGEFQLNLARGRYKIRAKAEVDGYPDPTFWLNADPLVKFPEISVGEKDITGLEIKLGKLGGFLNGSVFDRLSGNPLAGARLRLQDTKNSYAVVEVFTDTDGHFQFTVPSKPMVVSATAPGHKPMTFRSGEHLVVSPREHRHIEFQLDRE